MKKMLIALLIVCLHTPGANLNAQQAVDINTADSQELADRLKGIGPAKATAIVEFRSVNGPFRSIEDLLHVKGIGVKTLEKLRDSIRLGSLETSQKLINDAREGEEQTRLVIRNIIERAKASSLAAPARN